MYDWIMTAQDSKIDEYVSCADTMLNWQAGILNSFDIPYSNGFTEGCNNRIKVLKRNAYGYRNYRRFRTRILHMFITNMNLLMYQTSPHKTTWNNKNDHNYIWILSFYLNY